MIALISSDGVLFRVPILIASESLLLKDILEEGGLDEAIPLPNVTGATLQRVIEFLQHHKVKPLGEIPAPLRSSRLEDVVPPWDADFIKGGDLFQVTRAAHYLDIPSLLQLGVAQLSCQIKGKSVKQVRGMFKITKEFSLEEKERHEATKDWVTQFQCDSGGPSVR